MGMEQPEPRDSPPLVGDYIRDRVFQFFKLTKLKKTDFGAPLSDKNGYQLVQSWFKKKRSPDLKSLFRLECLAKRLGFSYTLDSFIRGTVEEREGQIPDEQPEMTPAEVLDADSLDRGQAHEWVDEMVANERMRAAMHEYLRKYPARSWPEQELKDTVMLIVGGETPIVARRTAEQKRVKSEVGKHERPVDLSAPKKTRVTDKRRGSTGKRSRGST